MTARRMTLTALLVTVLGGFAVTGCSPVESTALPVTSVPSAATGVLPTVDPSAAPSSAPATVSAEQTYQQQVVQLAPGPVDEASGIAASVASPGAYFLVDDDSVDQIFAVGTDGALLATIGVEGMHRPHAEAISDGPCGPTPLPDKAAAQNCVYVGGIGDNSLSREDIVVFRLAEPDLSAPPAGRVVADEWRYTYPDGPHNAESLMVAADGTMLIVTNSSDRGPARIYRAEPGGGQLSFVREFTPPAPEFPRKTIFTGNVVTDMAVAPGGVLLLTYDELTEYTAPDPEADISGFPDWPHHRLPMPELPQPEGIAAMVSGCGYVVASEAGPAGSNASLGVVSCA